jgi:hypothetical protein
MTIFPRCIPKDFFVVKLIQSASFVNMLAIKEKKYI